jgi:hypothetical protein
MGTITNAMKDYSRLGFNDRRLAQVEPLSGQHKDVKFLQSVFKAGSDHDPKL